jgi:hypothetical protein
VKPPQKREEVRRFRLTCRTMLSKNLQLFIVVSAAGVLLTVHARNVSASCCMLFPASLAPAACAAAAAWPKTQEELVLFML